MEYKTIENILSAMKYGTTAAAALKALKGKPRAPAKLQPSATYLPHGDTQGGKQLKPKASKKRKKKPKGVKEDIKAIKKRLGKLPPNTYDHVSGLRPLEMVNDINEKEVYFIKCRLDELSYDTNAANVAGLDITASNERARILNRFFRIDLKNFGLGNIHIKYAFYVCGEDSDDSYLTNLKDLAGDLGNSISATVITRVTSSATANEYPEHLTLSMVTGECHNKIFNVDPKRWKQRGQVQQVVMGPGDTVTVSEGFGDYMYTGANRNNDPRQYHTGDIYLLLTVQGALGKMPADDATAPNLLGYLPGDLYASAFESYTYVVNDGEGRRVLSATNEFQSTNFGATAQTVTNEDPVLETVG